MELTFAPRGVLQINDARITFRNFRGEGSMYNAPGKRNFSLIIPDMEIAEELQKDVNSYGVAWNVKINAPREEGDSPFIHLPVKVAFNERGPKIYLVSGDNKQLITEDTVDMLDYIDIRSVDLDIRPYDDELNGRPFRTAYLQAMWVVQEVDRFSERLDGDELSGREEMPFDR